MFGRRSGGDRVFPAVAGAAATSAAWTGPEKPDPAIFDLALRHAGCAASEPVMIGDRLDNDIRPARLLGWRTMRVLQGPGRFQSPRDSWDEPDLTVANVTLIPPALIGRIQNCEIGAIRIASETWGTPVGRASPSLWTRRATAKGDRAALAEPMRREIPMRLPHNPAAVVFDMDGLLFDTETLYQEAIQFAAAEGGHEVAVDIFKRMVGVPWAQSRTMLLSHFGEAFPVDEFQETWVRHFWVIAETRLALKPGALELLDTLDQLRLPRAIATSSYRRTVERHLTAHNLMGRFQEIVGHGDYENGKPAPDPFLKAAERLGVEPRYCLALEDSHNGVRSASSAGMITIMVPDLLEPTDEIRGLCALIVRDLHEVRSLILAAVDRSGLRF